MKNKDGFTLVELLVCIVIIASLAITLAIDSQGLINSGVKKQNRSTMSDIFTAASVYCNIKISENDKCEPTLEDLINEGLLNENYLEKLNPLYGDKKFSSEDQVIVTFDEGEKKLTFKSNDKCFLEEAKIDSYKDWGKC